MSNKKEASPQKVAANRANAKRSTGPTTPAGKAKASQNSYRHGFYAKSMFPNERVRAQDEAAYEMLYKAIRDYYSPRGSEEERLVEQLAKENLRRVRVEKIEQQAIAESGVHAFMHSCFIPNILRCETTASHEIRRLTERLEALQEKRGDEEAEFGSEEGEEGDAAGTPAVTCPEPPVTPSGEATELPESCDGQEPAAPLPAPLAAD
jgi:hypothetical protein